MAKRVPILSQTLPPNRFPPFLPEDNDASAFASIQEITCSNEDLKELLKMDFGQFYSRILYDKQLKKFLDSFLMHKSRAFDDRLVCDDGRTKSAVTTSTFRKNMIQLSKRVLLALHRVLFDPHRPEYYTDTKFGISLYDNWIFDIPKMMDISALYAASNPKVVKDMWSQLLKLQPKYENDFKGALEDTCKALATVHAKVKAKAGVSSTVADDMLCYLRDLLSTLMSTVTVFERAAKIILAVNSKTEASLLPALCECYVDTQVVLQNKCSDMDLWMEVSGLLLLLTRHLVHHSACADGQAAVDRDIVAVTLQSLLAQDKGNTGDLSDFISAVVAAHEHWQKSQLSHQHIVQTALAKPAGTQRDTSSPKQHEIRLLIAQVQQVLPDLGEGFVAAVLSARDNDVQATIGTLLDGELPEAARGISKNASFAEFTQLQRGGARKQHKPAKSVGFASKSVINGHQPTQWMGKKPITFDKSLTKQSPLRRYDLYDDEYDDGFDAPPLLSFERQSSLDTLGSDSDGDGDGGLPIFANPNHGRNAKTRTEMLLSSTNETPQELAAKKDHLAKQILSLMTKSNSLDRRASDFATKRAFFKEQIDLVKQKLKKCELQPETDTTSVKSIGGPKHPTQTDRSRQKGGSGSGRGRGKARGRGRGGNSSQGRGSSRGRGGASGGRSRNKKKRGNAKSSGKHSSHVRRVR